MHILGINAYHGDAAAAIISDGRLIAAGEEERFNRKKHCAGFPTESIRYCLEAAGVSIEDVEHIGISRDPSAHLHKKILQTVSRDLNPRYYDLISEFHKITGVPVVLNTSFNENEPIVCTPRNAIECLLKTRMDVLYLGNDALRRPATGAQV